LRDRDTRAWAPAAIRREFGIRATLKEGHHGILNVAVGDQVLWTNEGQGCRLPRKCSALQRAGRRRGDDAADAGDAGSQVLRLTADFPRSPHVRALNVALRMT